ncbi:hypothetical protein [Microbacterium sp. YY-01]|uniref:hypothetical protein n=1 Tax=Microbacterium sp. YY-01 TaxID=3421634 RepID=UPI003D178744
MSDKDQTRPLVMLLVWLTVIAFIVFIYLTAAVFITQGINEIAGNGVTLSPIVKFIYAYIVIIQAPFMLARRR